MLVIFDCDGVLVDSEPLANEVLAQYLSALGLPHTVEDCYRDYRGLSMASVLQTVEARLGRPLPERFLERLQKETIAVFRQHLQPVAGVEAVVRQLVEKEVPICVASSGSPEKLATTLALTGLSNYFDGRIFSAVEVARGKPEPDLFLHAARSMGVTPREAVVIEDSLPGIQAARAAGMPVLAHCPPDVYGDRLLATAQRLGCLTFRHMAQCSELLRGCLSDWTRP